MTGLFSDPCRCACSTAARVDGSRMLGGRSGRPLGLRGQVLRHEPRHRCNICGPGPALGKRNPKIDSRSSE